MFKTKEFKRMSKKDLLELLVLQSKKIDKLQIELNNTKKALNDKQIIIKESGSIAEASLKLNKVFETAQEAADQYLENIRILFNKEDKEKYEE